ncbi:MAG: hypothetical protein GY856_42000 [bacterium]|nr:hypothetical protein [bacterium]
MDDAKREQLTSLSRAQTPEEIGEFWDTHSLADFADQTREASFEVRAERRRRITLAPELYEQIEAHARRQGLVAETLVNLWLSERLRKAG